MTVLRHDTNQAASGIDRLAITAYTTYARLGWSRVVSKQPIHQLKRVFYCPQNGKTMGHFRRDNPGWVYLLVEENRRYFKIGKTKTPHNRTSMLAIQLPFPVKVVHIISAPYDMDVAEHYLHDHFAHRRVNGEWFELTPDDVKWLHSIGSLDPVLPEFEEEYWAWLETHYDLGYDLSTTDDDDLVF